MLAPVRRLFLPNWSDPQTRRPFQSHCQHTLRLSAHCNAAFCSLPRLSFGVARPFPKLGNPHGERPSAACRLRARLCRRRRKRRGRHEVGVRRGRRSRGSVGLCEDRLARLGGLRRLGRLRRFGSRRRLTRGGRCRSRSLVRGVAANRAHAIAAASHRLRAAWCGSGSGRRRLVLTPNRCGGRSGRSRAARTARGPASQRHGVRQGLARQPERVAEPAPQLPPPAPLATR